MITAIKSKAVKVVESRTLPPAVRVQQEMMTMRETDQWMCEHYARKN